MSGLLRLQAEQGLINAQISIGSDDSSGITKMLVEFQKAFPSAKIEQAASLPDGDPYLWQVSQGGEPKEVFGRAGEMFWWSVKYLTHRNWEPFHVESDRIIYFRYV